MAPLFEFTNTFDSSITIGDVTVPLHVKRLSRAEVDAMEKSWAELMVAPKGSAAPGGHGPCAKCGASADEQAEARRIEEWDTAVLKERLAFWESTIRECITLDDDLIINRGKSVTDGAGLIEIFYARKDVLRALVTEVYLQNHLVGLLVKNSKSPSASATGSAPSTQEGPAAAGSIPARTATNAASSNSAPAVDVTAEKSGGSADGLKSSRSNAAGEPVH